MKPLTEAEIADIDRRACIAGNGVIGLEVADYKRLLLALHEAYYETQQLRDETRWRLPGADGVWEELPPGFADFSDLVLLKFRNNGCIVTREAHHRRKKNVWVLSSNKSEIKPANAVGWLPLLTEDEAAYTPATPGAVDAGETT